MHAIDFEAVHGRTSLAFANNHHTVLYMTDLELGLEYRHVRVQVD